MKSLLLLGELLRAFHDDGWRRCSRLVFVELFAPFAVECGPHVDIDGKALSRMAFIDTADRRHVAVIASVRHANVPQP